MFVLGPGAVVIGAYQIELSTAGKIAFFVVMVCVWAWAGYGWSLWRQRNGQTSSPKPGVAGDVNPALIVELPENESFSSLTIGPYGVKISRGSAVTVWFYADSPDVTKLAVDGKTERGDLIDLRALLPVRREVAVKIGERAILSMANGDVMQILLVGVLCYDPHGDDRDEVRVRYRIHRDAEHLIEAL